MTRDHAHPAARRKKSWPDVVLRARIRGGTMLLVEDSRLISASIRMMFHGSGGRLRRAETMLDARRHLTLYMPDVALIDLNLPDGSGIDLIRELASRRSKPQLIIAISAQIDLESQALAAGADRFIAKPFASIAQFRNLLSPIFFAAAENAEGPHVPATDTIALRDDLRVAADLLRSPPDAQRKGFALDFIDGLARCSNDAGLRDAVNEARETGSQLYLVQELHHRLDTHPVI